MSCYHRTRETGWVLLWVCVKRLVGIRLCTHLVGEGDGAGLVPLPKTFNLCGVYPIPAGAGGFAPWAGPLVPLKAHRPEKAPFPALRVGVHAAGGDGKKARSPVVRVLALLCGPHPSQTPPSGHGASPGVHCHRSRTREVNV